MEHRAASLQQLSFFLSNATEKFEKQITE